MQAIFLAVACHEQFSENQLRALSPLMFENIQGKKRGKSRRRTLVKSARQQTAQALPAAPAVAQQPAKAGLCGLVFRADGDGHLLWKGTHVVVSRHCPHFQVSIPLYSSSHREHVLQMSYAQALLRGIQLHQACPSRTPRKVVVTRHQGDSVLVLSQTMFSSLPDTPTAAMDLPGPAAATGLPPALGRPSPAPLRSADSSPRPGPTGQLSFLAMLHKALVASVGEQATVTSYRDGKEVLGGAALPGGRASPVA